MDTVDALATLCAIGLLALVAIAVLGYLTRDLWKALKEAMDND